MYNSGALLHAHTRHHYLQEKYKFGLYRIYSRYLFNRSTIFCMKTNCDWSNWTGSVTNHTLPQLQSKEFYIFCMKTNSDWSNWAGLVNSHNPSRKSKSIGIFCIYGDFNINWEEMLSNIDINIMWNKFITIVEEVIDKMVPTKI